MDNPGGGALVSVENPGGGALVAAGARVVGDTNTSAIYVTDLPKNFIGGDEALHFALGELFGQYGKIKKIELYMQEGILETQDFTGNALVVYHKTKKTGTREKGDPVMDACTELDNKWRMLGKRGWRIHCEAAEWQKEGFDVKTRVKTHPCVEISNLWDYDPSWTMAKFAELQEGIRTEALKHVEQPFVKVEPSSGTATIWTKGAQDAMKLASIMHKSLFMGRKITTSLCRKQKPVADPKLKVPTGDLSMQLPTEVWDGSGPIPGTEEAIGPVGPEQGPALPTEDVEIGPMAGPAALLPKGCICRLRNLVSKPENNGKKVRVTAFLEDLGKYSVQMDDGRTVKVKAENLEQLQDDPPASKKKKIVEAEIIGPVNIDDEEDADAAEAEAAATLAAAQNMAAGNVRHGPEPVHDPLKDGFLPTVCVDPELLPKREEPEPEETEEKRRDRSRSRARRQEERIAAAKARLQAEPAARPSWVVPSPEELAKLAAAKGGGGGTVGGALYKEPEQSREELMKLSVGKLKELLKEFGRNARGCLEKRDFVDRLKPPPKA